MQINIKTSEKNVEIIKRLSTKLLENAKENIIARIALCFSLSTGRKFNQNEFNLFDSKGKEYKDHILFDQKYRDFYIALVCQHYSITKSNEYLPKYIKLHIDDGLILLDNFVQNNKDYSFFEFLTDNVDKNLSFLNSLETTYDYVQNNHQDIQKNYYQELIKFKVGEDNATQSDIIFSFNDAKYNNYHIAVAGTSGTGKTYFAHSLISKILKESNNQINYLFLDFKGIKGDDVKKFQSFFDNSKTKVIDAPNSKFPINPLAHIDTINEKNKKLGIDKLVDIICQYSKIGQKQKNYLNKAIVESFIDLPKGEYPSFQTIYDNLKNIYDKEDTLSSILDDLSKYDIFDNNVNGHSLINNNYYFSLSGELSDSIRFTSLFLIINYIYNTFMNMENVSIENGAAGIRYLLVIDEAHVIFKQKKYHNILDKLLREIRSKGVSIILLSQQIEEFNQETVNFSDNCDRVFLFDIKNKNNSKMINKFLGFSDNTSVAVARSFEHLVRGQLISNINEDNYKKGNLITIYKESK